MEKTITSKEEELPCIPQKEFFSIGEVGILCRVKPHVLRYWEQEFKQLRPIKRLGNRRYYRYQDVLLVRRIYHMLYQQGYTINGAKNQLAAEKIVPNPEAKLTEYRQAINETIHMLDDVLALLN